MIRFLSQKYSYNYRIYDGENWIDAVRWDNYHGSAPHVDVRYPETGSKISMPDKFRTPEEVIEEIYRIRDDLKTKWLKR